MPARLSLTQCALISMLLVLPFPLAAQVAPQATDIADLSVTKTAPPTAFGGAPITYVINVANAGPDGAFGIGNVGIHAEDVHATSATGVELSDPLPPQTTFVSLNQTSGPSFSCTTPAVGANGTVTCTIANLAAGATAAFSLVVTTPLAASGTITNTATVSELAASDFNPSNNSASASTTISPSPAIPAMSPLMLALLAIALALIGFSIARTAI